MTSELRCSGCGSPFKGEKRTRGNGPTFCPSCRGDVVVPTSERYNPLNLPLGPSHSEVEARQELRQILLNQVLDEAEERSAMEATRRVLGEAEAEEWLAQFDLSPRRSRRRGRRAGAQNSDGTAYWVEYRDGNGGRWVERKNASVVRTYDWHSNA